MIGKNLKISKDDMLYLFNYSSHTRLYLEFTFSRKIDKKCIQKIIGGNEQITHNFFDFQKFCAKLTFFAFMASLIQEDACWGSIVTTIYKNHVFSSKEGLPSCKTRTVHFVMLFWYCYFRNYCIRHAVTDKTCFIK